MTRAEKYVAYWLWTGAVLIFAMLVVGGITRLTGSGLSMTDWNLIMGALPPMSTAEWQEAFAQYKQFPEYQQLNYGMSLDDFKAIFFWEYMHRMLGRFIGIVFIVPFGWFWYRGYFSKQMFRRALILFGLGAAQAAMGWIMVKSGLVDVPYVSHYRLAAHLLLAFVLIGFCVWYALDLQRSSTSTSAQQRFRLSKIKNWSLVVVVMFGLQVFWGALTAGLDAGLIYNTFPLMNGSWLPRSAFSMQPVLINLLEHPGTVQWMHRVVGTLLLAATITLWFQTYSLNKMSKLKLWGHVLAVVLILQYLLGVLTVMYRVPVALGVTHQAVAMIFWVAWLMYYHQIKMISVPENELATSSA